MKIAGGDAKAASAASVALEARRRIDAMFKVDSMEPGGRKAARDAELRPLMEDFGGWARAQLPLASPKLAPHRALQYAVEFWPYVMNVLEDGAPGALEQRRRAGPANLRRRAQELALQRCAASAAIYSVTTTAKANGLNPRLYVEWLLTEMPNAGELTDEVVDSFLPWSDRVPESCKLDPAAAEKAKEMPDDFIINIDPDAFDDEMANNAEEGL